LDFKELDSWQREFRCRNSCDFATV